MAERAPEERETVLEGVGGVRFCGGGIDFYELPEGCIAAIIAFTSPGDACRLAAVSKLFKSAADSDAVWERFLPSDYADILLNRSDDGAQLLSSLSKKELFLHLAARPLLIDGGTKSFSLEKSTCKKSYSIAARDLDIIWGDTPRYWTFHSTPDSRFPEVAELVTVCWLEIKGKINASMLSPETNYGAYLIFKMAEAAYGFYYPAEAVVKTAGGETVNQNVYLEPEEGQNRSYQMIHRRRLFNRNRASMTVMPPTMKRKTDVKFPKRREDGWMEVEIGEFLTHRDEDGEVELSVLEVKGGNWKGGLVLEGIEIRPKVVMQEAEPDAGLHSGGESEDITIPQPSFDAPIENEMEVQQELQVDKSKKWKGKSGKMLTRVTVPRIRIQGEGSERNESYSKDFISEAEETHRNVGKATGLSIASSDNVMIHRIKRNLRKYLTERR